MHARRLLGTLVATLVVAAGVPLLTAVSAQAAAYRYWSYWHGPGSACVPAPVVGWNLAGTGPASCPVHDGDVEGWRFATSANARSAPAPRYGAATAFASLCKGTPAKPGQVRVALVVDFGTTADYGAGDGPPADPLRGQCVSVPEDSTGLDVLNGAKLDIRTAPSGLICALDGHPASGCGEVVAVPPPRTPSPTAKPRPTTRPTPSARPDRAPTPPTAAGAVLAPTSAGPSHPAQVPGPAPSRTVGAPSSAGAVPGLSPSPGQPGADASTPGGATADLGAEPSPTLLVGMPASQGTGTGSPWAAILAVMAVAALGGAAYWRHRRSP